MALGRRVGADGRIFIFEPDRQIFHVLQKNSGSNFLEKLVVPNLIAVSDLCGEVVFQAGVGAESRLSFNAGAEDRGFSVRVRRITLDESFRRFS